MAEVALEHVVKDYAGGVRAVHDLSLTAAQGEVLVLVGPSGSGKTTVLRLIAGLETPSAGTIRIGGRRVNEVPPHQRNVALVFQGENLYPHMNVRDNLGFSLYLREERSWLRRLWQRCFQPGQAAEVRRQERERSERVQEAARLLGLETVLGRMPGHLSGGQKQRVGLGRALVRRPDVFLLDEPLSNLDVSLRGELRRELHLLQRRFRATMVYVTHDQMEAMTLGTRVGVLDRGVLQQVDRPETLYERPRNRFVAGFIGWPPMNFADGRVGRAEGGPIFETEGWSLPLAPALEALAGKEVTLGIRPEHVRPARNEREEWALPMEVALVELLGDACLVSFQREGWRAAGKLDARQKIQVGQTVEVTFEMQQIHWFDRSSGVRLGLAVD